MYQRPLRPDELAHFGIKGMHWGDRRYQNEDGSLTPAGMRRYGRMKYERDQLTNRIGKLEKRKDKQSSKLDAYHKKYNSVVTKADSKYLNNKGYKKYIYAQQELTTLSDQKEALGLAKSIEGDVPKIHKIQSKIDILDKKIGVQKDIQKKNAVAYQKALEKYHKYMRKGDVYLKKINKYQLKSAKIYTQIKNNERMIKALNTSMNQVKTQYEKQYKEYERQLEEEAQQARMVAYMAGAMPGF